MITVVAIGKKHETWLVEGIERYEKRLKVPFSTKWVFLGSSSQKGPIASKEESENIINTLKPDDFVVLLDERGDMYTSPAFSQKIVYPLEQSKHVVMVIGGAYGVDEKVRQRANMTWSLSPLVFPHQLIRLILVEQLYRAQAIHYGFPYHNE